jgi:hypothetical protein
MRLQKVVLGILALLIAAGTAARLSAGGSDKAADIMAAARKAIGGTKLEAMKTFSAEAKTQRNIGNFQMASDLELMLAMPDKYLRSESSSGGPVNFSSTSGFVGDRPLARSGSTSGGGAMVIRMGPGGQLPDEKPTPEQQAELDRLALRTARQDISRLMLGWFAAAHPSVSATYAYAGEAESPDGKADVIDVKGADDFSARIFIDQQSHLPLMLTYQGPQRRVITSGGGPTVLSPQGSSQVHTQTRQMSDEERKKTNEAMQKQIEQARSQPPAMVEYRLYFSEWTDVDGIKFPKKLQRGTGGAIEEEWTIDKIKVNPKVDLKKFDTQD